MEYKLVQVVRIVDMNEEIINEILFDHGNFETLFLPIGSSVVSYPLGLKGFEVVYDKRPMSLENKKSYKVVDIELNLIEADSVVRAYLEPVTLILGQHDVGEFIG